MLPKPRTEQELYFARECTGKDKLGVARFVADKMTSYFTPIFHIQDKPDMLKTYESKDMLTRSKFNKDYPTWRRDCGADKWIDKQSEIDAENSSHIYWLKEWRKLLEGDEKRVEKIETVLGEYYIPEEAHQVAEVFNGKVQGWED